jgi:hypothetical protein
LPAQHCRQPVDEVPKAGLYLHLANPANVPTSDMRSTSFLNTG